MGKSKDIRQSVEGAGARAAHSLSRNDQRADWPRPNVNSLIGARDEAFTA